MLFNTRIVRTLTQASRWHPPGPEVHRDPGLIQEDCGDLRQSGLCLANWQKEDLRELRFANQAGSSLFPFRLINPSKKRASSFVKTNYSGSPTGIRGPKWCLFGHASKRYPQNAYAYARNIRATVGRWHVSSSHLPKSGSKLTPRLLHRLPNETQRVQRLRRIVG